MPKKLGPERAHFGGEHGLITETSGDTTKYYWRCEFCNWEMGGKCFGNEKARIHLSGDVNLKNGQIANLCEKAPEHVKKQFSELERAKRLERLQKANTRKRGIELMNANPLSPTNAKKRSRQSTLPFSPQKLLSDQEVDDAWGLACFGLDLAPNKLNDPLFRNAFHATQNSSKRLFILFYLYQYPFYFFTPLPYKISAGTNV